MVPYVGDIWSLGMTIVYLFNRHHRKDQKDELSSYLKMDPESEIDIINFILMENPTPSFKDEKLTRFVNECLEKNPKLRPTAAKLIQHHLFI